MAASFYSGYTVRPEGVFAARWNTLRPFAGTPVFSSHDSLAWGRMKEKGGGKL